LKYLTQVFKPITALAAGEMGTVESPIPGNKYFEPGGIFLLISNLFMLAGTIGGLFFIIQIIGAGYEYITAGADSKKVDAAWTKIWQSILGVIIIASAFTLATVIERLTGITFLTPKLYGPN